MNDDVNLPAASTSGGQGDDHAERVFERTRPRQGVEEADAFLRSVVRLGASDLHLKSGQPPRLRIGGKLRRVDREPAPTAEFEARILGFLTDEQRARLLAVGAVDFAYDLDGEVRFRINVYRQESGISLAARIVPRSIPSFDQLHLPPIVAELAGARRGLILVAGTTGSGKSTTLAAIVQRINETRHEHILTIEDPIEFLFESKNSLVNQREIGINVADFATALRDMLREDPDVVLIGEMRDAETFRAAVQAADTGHLVLSTVHAANPAQAVARLVNMFPLDEQNEIRRSLAFSLRAVVAQQLIPSMAEDVERVPALEVLISTPFTRKLIHEAREAELADAVRSGDEGMFCFAESLVSLHKAKLIDEETGCQAAPNPEEFKRLLAGIRTSQY